MDSAPAGQFDHEAHLVAGSDACVASIGRLVRLRKLLAYVRSGEPDLTNRQMAIIQTVAWTEGPHTVRALAAILDVSKPVITRALTSLSELGLMRRRIDPHDRRSIFAEMTAEGALFLERIERICGHA